MERRKFLQFSGLVVADAIGGRLTPGSGVALERMLAGDRLPKAAAVSDEIFWRRIRAFYTPPSEYIDLDHANTSPTAGPVVDSFVRRLRRLSQAPAERFNTMWDDDLDKVARPALASYLGTTVDRLAFVGSATVGLNTVLHGFPLERGDEIIVTDHEYPDMIETILQRGKREGILMRVVRVPAPTEDRLTLVARVAETITARTKLLLISQVSAWSGEVLPVAEVTATARARGVAVLVDAAQSVGLLDVSFDQIGCDFLGTSLHKWLGAPIASGALVMRPEHVGRVWPLHPPSWDTAKHPMEIYEWSGTFDMAARATITDALAFQRKLGAEQKRARLRYLGDHWQNKVREVPNIHIFTPRDPSRSVGVASVMVEGVSSEKLAKHLRRRRGLLVQDKSGRHSPYVNALRVSPGVYTTPRELDRLVDELTDIARHGLPIEE
ncbi:MAG: aminotransferase class V-fold PLP-dependent enzyme [Acidobacteriota bacterium]|nr:aminotransferase class V-fold PLP-dependent enzyme [Acidobacteriota bacterium]